jgi:hypothetical protein
MTAAEIRAGITLDCAAAEAPVLTAADLDALVLGARRRDAAGALPNAAGWVETYDANAAKARAWRIKQARVAGTQIRESFDGDYGSADFRALEFARLAERYERRAIRSVPIARPVYP